MKKSMSLEDYLRERIEKANEELKRLKMENDEKEAKLIMNNLIEGTMDLNELDLRQLKGLSKFAANMSKQLQKRNQQLMNHPPPPAADAAPPPIVASHEAGQVQSGGGDVGPSTPQSMVVHGNKDP